MHVDFETVALNFKEGSDFSVSACHGLRREFLIAAIHGGNIQLYTSDMAKTIAAETHGLYLFEGFAQSASQRLYIPSNHFQEPQFGEMAPQYNRVVAIHGLKEERGPKVLVGGLDKHLVNQILESLNSADIPARAYTKPVMAVSSNNVCNRGASGKGVQLEIPRAIRTHEVLRTHICQIISNSLPMTPEIHP
jgi:phage replication-related protein YjqB (UPF0714/DUF867 family)